MTILFPIEIASRELLYKVYLATLFATNGYTCFLGSKREINAIINNLDDFIYFDKGFHQGVSETLHKKILQRGGHIVSLDEEGAVDYGDNSTLLGRYQKNLFQNADLVFFWGNYQKSLISDDVLKLSKTSVTGHPRFEILQPKYHDLYNEDTIEIKKRFGDFVLINTNMGFGNNLKGEEFVLNNYGERFKNIEQIVANDKAKVAAIITLVKHLAVAYNYHIILRPHPEENQTLYKEAFKSHANVSVLFEKSAVPWLIACKHIVHFDCTTAIESLMVGKKPIAYIPTTVDKDLLTVLPVKASCVAETVQEVMDQISVRENNLETSEGYPQWLIDRFAINMESSKIIISAVDDLVKAKHSDRKEVTLKSILLKLKFKERLKKLLGRSNNLVNAKLKGFNEFEIQSIINRIRQVNPEIDEINTEKVLTNLYCFKGSI